MNLIATSSQSPITLLVTHVNTSQPSAGNEVRIYKLIHWLKEQGHKVILVLRTMEQNQLKSQERASLQGQVDELYEVYDEKVRNDSTIFDTAHTLYQRVLEWEQQQFTGTNTSEFSLAPSRASCETRSSTIWERLIERQGRFFTPSLALCLDQVVKKYQINYFFVEYIFMSRAFYFAQTESLKIVDTHDAFSSKKEKVLRFGFEDPFSLDPYEEQFLLSRSDVIIAIQDIEKELFFKLCPDKRVVTTPIDYDLPTVSCKETHAAEVLIVASDNPFNLRCTKEFIKYCWPFVLKSNLEARLKVVGKVCRELTSDDSSIDLCGFVGDLQEEYLKASVVANPTYAGTGLKIKSIEALSYGAPLVAWPNGLEGIPRSTENGFFECYDWIDFAKTIVRVLSDPTLQQRCRQAALHLVKGYYQKEVVYSELGKELSPDQRIDCVKSV